MEARPHPRSLGEPPAQFRPLSLLWNLRSGTWEASEPCGIPKLIPEYPPPMLHRRLWDSVRDAVSTEPHALRHEQPVRPVSRPPSKPPSALPRCGLLLPAMPSSIGPDHNNSSGLASRIRGRRCQARGGRFPTASVGHHRQRPQAGMRCAGSAIFQRLFARR